MNNRFLLASVFAWLFAIAPAHADWTGINATGATITFKNSGNCASVVCVPVAQPVDSTGASFGVTANPLFVAPGSGQTFPVSASSLPLPSGAATSALQSTINTTLGSPFQAGGSIGNTSFAVTQGTASNLNATVVGAGVAGTPAGGVVSVQGVASGTAVPISAASLPLPTGASTAAGLTTINSTLGSPFQAGGSIGNSSFGATQATAANLNATVVGTGTFAVQATLQPSATTAIGKVDPNTLGNWGLVASTQNGTTPTNMMLMGAQFNTTPTTITTGNVSPFQLDANGNLLVNVKAGGGSGGTSSSFSSAFPATGTAAGMSQGGNMVALTGTSGNLNVQCANCSGSGASGTDEGAFTAGTSTFAPGGGFFQTTATNNPLTNGQWGTWQMTANRAGFVNLRNASGTEIGTASTPVQVSLANTATNATAVKVDGSGVTQPVSGTVTANQGGVWSATVTQGTAANLNATVTQGTAAAVTAPWPVYGGQPASTTMQNGATANGNGSTLTVTGYQTALVNVNCSVACSGGTTINFEGTDSTGTFFSVAALPVAGTSGAVSTTTTSGQFWVPVSGLTTIRARISAYSAGTITVTGTAVFGVNASLTQVANTNSNIAPGDSVSTATYGTASPVIGVPFLWNGTSYDRWKSVSTGVGSVGIASGGVASGAIASGAIASGAFASGAVASGAYASGSLASGAVVDITNFTGSTGSAPPSKAAYLGANASGATGGQMRGLINCDNHTFKHITTATDTVAVQGVASQTIYICGWRSRAAGTATWFLENTASTNNNCSSTLTQITGVASEVANSGDVTYNPIWGGLKNTSGNGLCINSTGTGGVDVDIWYTQL